MEPKDFSYFVALLMCMFLFSFSLYHFPISYWLMYIEAAPGEFAYSALLGNIWRLVFGEVSLSLTLTGTMLCIKLSKKKPFSYFMAVAMVELGILFQTGIFSISLKGFQSILLSSAEGLHWIYKTCLVPFILFFSFFLLYAAIKGWIGDPRILYSITAMMFIPVTLDIADWILSGYIGTGGGALIMGLSFFVSWALIWLGGLFKLRYGLPLITMGAIMNWSPYGVGIIMVALTYMLRTKKYSKTFLAAMLMMVIGFSFGTYNILRSPILK